MPDAHPTRTHALLMDVEHRLDQAWGDACAASEEAKSSAEVSAAEDVRCQVERVLKFCNGACADLIDRPPPGDDGDYVDGDYAVLALGQVRADLLYPR